MFPIIPADSAAALSGNDEGIFCFGEPFTDATNKVSNVGVVASNVTGVGTARGSSMATEYGDDKGIVVYGYYTPQPGPTGFTAISNLVSNSGVVAADVAGVGTVRGNGGACNYGGDKGIFGFGYNNVSSNPAPWSSLVSNTGVVASDVSFPAGVTARIQNCGTEYGTQTAIFGYGSDPARCAITNLVSSAGVIAADQAATTGSARNAPAACSFGYDKGLFGYGQTTGGKTAVTNIVSNTGVVAADVSGVGTARSDLAACEYGQDKGIFGFGHSSSSPVGMTNLISNLGVAATDVAAVGTARATPSGCSFN
tara:strand:- start:5 stop:934 length:930 start_codon:yes stop_codon:yes gene_type:complete